MPSPSLGAIENGHSTQNPVLCPVPHHICDTVWVILACCKAKVGKEGRPRLNTHPEVMRLRLSLDHSVDVKAPGCSRIMEVEVKLEETDGYLMEGHCCELNELQVKAVRGQCCGLECFNQLNENISILRS